MSQTERTLCKLERVMNKYGLEDLGDDLEAHWVGKKEDKSVRELEDVVNEKILDAALRDNNIILDEKIVKMIATTIANGETPLLEYDLQDRGVNIDVIEEDFISYQSVHNYLSDVRGIAFEEERDQKTTASTVESLGGTDTQTEQVYRNVTEKLHNRGELEGELPEIDVDVRLVCPDCETRTDARVYLHNGGCPESTCVGNTQPVQ